MPPNIQEELQQPLEKFGTDITALARENKLDPVIGRDEEIRRTMQILARRTKNNPVLIGEPGVGKTAIKMDGIIPSHNLWQDLSDFRKKNILRLP